MNPFPRGPALAEYVEAVAGALEGAPPASASTALASHVAYESNLVAAADKAIETGLRLIELKARVRKEFGHGYWEEYLAETFPFTARTAQRYMSQAKQSLRPGNDSLSFLKRHRAVKIIAGIAKK